MKLGFLQPIESFGTDVPNLVKKGLELFCCMVHWCNLYLKGFSWIRSGTLQVNDSDKDFFQSKCSE
jgi:hypothetical protein